MRENARKFSRVLIPLALVAAGLALGLSMTVASANGGMGIEILEPKPGEHVLVSQDFDLQVVFTVTEPITNVYPSVTISPPDSAVVKEGPDPNVPLTPQDNEEGKAAAWWKLHCTAEGTTTITVTGCSETGICVSKSVTVVQKPGHPKLVAEIVKPEKRQTYVSSTWSVWAEIGNEGGEAALETAATIKIEGPAELAAGGAMIELGTIEPGETPEAVWTLHCTGEGDVWITVTPSGMDDATGEAIPSDMIVAQRFKVEQVPGAAIKIEIEEPDDQEVICWEEAFDVKARITNVGYGPLTDLVATLDWSPYSGLGLSAPAISQTNDYLAKDEPWDVVWHVWCEDAGPTDYLWTAITVTVEGASEWCDCDVSAFDRVDVKQKYLIVEITDPDDGHWFKEGTGFPVDFEVTSCGSFLESVSAKVEVDEGLSIVGPAEVPLHDIYEESVPVEFDNVFNLKCKDGTRTGTYTVTVTGVAYGGQRRTNHDTQTVNQFRDDPELEITIMSPESSTWYSPGDEFLVTARVTATGGGYRPPVWSPSVTLTVEAGNAEILDGAVRHPGTLDPGESAVVTWKVRCTGPCDVDLVVEVSGENPQCGKHWRVPPAGSPPVTDSITVHQFPLKATIVQFPNEVASGSAFGIHAKIGWDDGACEECGYTCEDCGIPDVWATIEIIEGPATVEVDDIPVGTILCPEELTQDAEWTVKCTGPGTVKIRVKAWTTTNPETGEPLGKEVAVWSDFVAIRQVPRLVGYDFQLCKSWNYMSLPLIPPTTAINDVLNSLEGRYVEIWAYDAQTGDWSVYAPGKDPGWYGPLTKLTAVDHGKGYIIRMAWPETFVYEGYAWPPPGPGSEPPVYDVYPEWNLVGFTTLGLNQLSDMDAGDYLRSMNRAGGLGPEVVGDEARILRTYLCGYPGQWEELTDDDDDMRVGQSYWVYTSLSGLTIVPPLD